MSRLPTVQQYHYGWTCMSSWFSGHGATRDQAIDDWARDIRNRSYGGTTRYLKERVRRTKAKEERYATQTHQSGTVQPVQKGDIP